MCEHERHRNEREFFNEIYAANQNTGKWSSIDVLQQFVLICTFREKETVIKEEQKRFEVNNNRWETVRWRINLWLWLAFSNCSNICENIVEILKFLNDEESNLLGDRIADEFVFFTKIERDRDC